MKIKFLKNKKGFTILESIVAIMILSLAISGAFSSVVQGLSQASIAKDEIRAFYLAQEATEVIKNKRDSNQISKIKTGSGDWLDGIVSSCPSGNICLVDATNMSITSCGIGDWDSCNTKIRQNQTTYQYGYNVSWSETNFTRKVKIDVIDATKEIAVTVKISWTKGILPFSFEVKTHLFNWIP